LNRIRLQRNKKLNLNDMMKREAAHLLSEGKEPSAFIKIENAIREERLIEALNLLEIHIENLQLRVDNIQMSTRPPPDILEPLSTIIYSSPRVDIKELKQLNQNWVLKYGKPFVSDAMTNKMNVVNQQVYEKLAFYKAPKNMVYKILLSVSKMYNVNWKPPDEFVEEEVKTGGIEEPNEEQLLHNLESYSKNSKDINLNQESNNEQVDSDELDFDDDDLDLPEVPNSKVNNSKSGQMSTSTNLKSGPMNSNTKLSGQTNTNNSGQMKTKKDEDVPSVPEFVGFDDFDDIEFPNVPNPISNSSPLPQNNNKFNYNQNNDINQTDNNGSNDLDLPDIPSFNNNNNIDLDTDLPDVPIIHSQINVYKKDPGLNIPKKQYN